MTWDHGDEFEVTQFGDTKARYIYQNPPPFRVCISCATALDDRGRCQSLDCPLLGAVIPLPDWSAHYCQPDHDGRCFGCSR